MTAASPRLDADLTVNRARISGWRGTRAEVSRWLEAVPVATLGLGPEEMLYVPRLRARIGRGAAADPRAAAGPIAAELRALLAAAERDSLASPVPGKAYRFSSRLRYLAWLGALWLKDGSPPARTIFSAATGFGTLGEWQRSVLLRDAPALVAFAASLARIGTAARWVADFAPHDLLLIRDSLAAHFGLPPTESAMLFATEPAPLSFSPAPPRSAPPRGTRPVAAAPETLSVIRARIAEAAAALDVQDGGWRNLPPERRRLLLVLILFSHAPAFAGARGLAAHIAAAAGQAEPPRMAGPAPAEPVPTPAIVAAPQARPAGRRAPRPLVVRPVAPPTDPSLPCRARGGARAGADPARVPDAAAAPAPPEIAPASPVERIPTGFAGIFFLLNAFVALGLYPDFTEPLRHRLAPSPLWLADRIARRRFGAAYRRDPLCRWIAAHACSGPLPRDWAVEPGWTAGFAAAAPPRLAETGGRLTLWHGAGFPIADGPAALPRRLRAHARLCGCVRPPAELSFVPRRYRLPGDRTERWIACLALYLDARIRLATGDPAAGLDSLALPGEIELRDLDLIVHFRLASHPIGLRIAGLDRDLGWHPAEGRSIGFRFE